MRKRPVAMGAFGSQYNHDIIRDLRRKLANNQMIVLSLVRKFDLSEKEVEKIVREFMQLAQAEATTFPGEVENKALTDQE